MIKIYTTNYCPYCQASKSLLDEKSIKYETVDLTDDHEQREKLAEELNYRTVPMIFIDDKFIGGFSELQALDGKGALN